MGSSFRYFYPSCTFSPTYRHRVSLYIFFPFFKSARYHCFTSANFTTCKTPFSCGGTFSLPTAVAVLIPSPHQVSFSLESLPERKHKPRPYLTVRQIVHVSKGSFLAFFLSLPPRFCAWIFSLEYRKSSLYMYYSSVLIGPLGLGLVFALVSGTFPLQPIFLLKHTYGQIQWVGSTVANCSAFLLCCVPSFADSVCENELYTPPFLCG